MTVSIDDPLEQLEQHRLGPGLHLHLLPTDKWKTVVARLYVRRGLDEEATRLAMLSHLLVRGTASHPTRRAITRHLEELYGASLRTDVVKHGENQSLMVHLEFLADRYADGPISGDVLSFLGEMWTAPRRTDGGAFPEEPCEQEGRNLARQIEGLIDDKGSYALERCCRVMCPDEPFGIYEYGTAEAARSLDGTTMGRFYDEAVSDLPLDLYLIGPFDPARVRATVEEILEEVPRTGEAAGPRVGGHPEPGGEVRLVEEHLPVAQAKLCLGLRVDRDPRDGDYWKATLLQSVLGGGTHSKLFRTVRERDQLAYSVRASLEPVKGVLLISAGVPPASWEAARSVIEEQIEALREGDVAEEELERSRLSLLRKLRSLTDSASGLCGWHYARDRLLGRRRTLARTMELLRKGDRDDVVEAASWLRPDTVYVLLPPADPPGGSPA